MNHMNKEELLPGFVLAGLYEKSLVLINDETEQKSTQKVNGQSEKIYLGSYEKKIIVLVNDEANNYTNDANLTFLAGILKACKLNMLQIALINFNNNPVDFLKLKKEMMPEFLLLFGVTTLQVELPFDMPFYQVQQYSNCHITTAPSLIVLNKENAQAIAEKKKLWKSLQKMFNIEK